MVTGRRSDKRLWASARACSGDEEVNWKGMRGGSYVVAHALNSCSPVGAGFTAAEHEHCGSAKVSCDLGVGLNVRDPG